MRTYVINIFAILVVVCTMVHSLPMINPVALETIDSVVINGPVISAIEFENGGNLLHLVLKLNEY